MEEKFNEQFRNFVEGKRQLIPQKIKYDEMIATLQELMSGKPKSMSRHDAIFFETILYVSSNKKKFFIIMVSVE